MSTTPTLSDVHVNRPLTKMAALFMAGLQDFKADYLAPIAPSDKMSNTYFTLSQDYWFSDLMQKRGPGTAAIRKGWGVGQGSYLLDLWALGKDIDDQTRANADDELELEKTSMKFVARAERMNREQQFKATAWKTGVWSTDITGNTSASNISGASTIDQWNQAASTPIEDVEDMIVLGRKKTGLDLNVLAMGRPVWSALKKNPEILDRITGGSTSTNPAQVTPALVSNLLGIEIVILDAIENTAGHGNTFVGDFIFGKNALLMHRDDSAGLETPTAIRTITWQGYAGNRNGTRIMKWRDESVHSDIIEVESAFVHKIIAPDLGVFITGLVA